MQTELITAGKSVIKKQFTVTATQLNEREELATCIILQEIIALHDEIKVHTLGSLDYYTFLTTWHRVELGENIALRGDNIILNADYQFTEGISLDISIFAKRRSGKQTIPLAEAWFSFILRDSAYQPAVSNIAAKPRMTP